MNSLLSLREQDAVRRLIRTVRTWVPAELVQAVLFGSKARGTAGSDSDVDLLLIFRELPQDREPQATMAEEIAEGVSEEQQVEVAPWSVSLHDLRLGQRTPMLVDALEDAVPIWPASVEVPRLPFTPEDALRCASALLQRVEEGSEEVASRRWRGDVWGALRRARDDVVRLCTAALLLHGETRPRHALAVQRFLETCVAPGGHSNGCTPQLEWVRASFGRSGRDVDRPLGHAPGGLPALTESVDRLRDWVLAERGALEKRLRSEGNPGARHAYDWQYGPRMGRGDGGSQPRWHVHL